MKGLISKATVSTPTPINKIWNALIDPSMIKEYMVGTEVSSDWKVGSSIVWKGEYQGKKYEDKGEILKFEPKQILQYSHFSPLAGKPDKPENYHTVTIELSPDGDQTAITLSQDGNPTEESVQHTATFWQEMLERMKGLLEK